MSRTRDRVRGVFGRSRDASDDEETVEIADEANSWWADRPFLDHAIKRQTVTAPAQETEEPAIAGGFHTYFSTESLFDNPADGGARANASSAESNEPTHNVFGTPSPYRRDDPFQVLGVRPGASLAEITVRHRQLAKQFHPDLHDDATREQAEREMVKINAAYSELRRILRNVERLRVTAS